MVKLTNIRLVEGHAAIRADIEARGCSGWIEAWFEEDYRYEEIDGEIDPEALEAAYEALGRHLEDAVKPLFRLFVQTVNAVHAGAAIEVEAIGMKEGKGKRLVALDFQSKIGRAHV